MIVFLYFDFVELANSALQEEKLRVKLEENVKALETEYTSDTVLAQRLVLDWEGQKDARLGVLLVVVMVYASAEEKGSTIMSARMLEGGYQTHNICSL